MHRAHAALAVGMALVLFGCESREDVQRRAALAEARVYFEEAARAGDRGARTLESAAAKELLRLHEAREGARSEIARREAFLASEEGKKSPKATVEEQTRLLGEDRKRLTRAEEKIETQRKVVEANRTKLLALKAETEAARANPPADAGADRRTLD